MRPENGALSESARQGLETSLAARRWLSESWQGESFMAIGMLDVVITPQRMEALRQAIRGGPPAMEVAEAGHCVPEWGAPVAEEALRRSGLQPALSARARSGPAPRPRARRSPRR
jgi:hypothetical protein